MVHFVALFFTTSVRDYEPSLLTLHIDIYGVSYPYSDILLELSSRADLD